MKNEAELCTIIKNSLDYGYKIPDPTTMYGATIPRPCDIFGILGGKPIYIEAKFSNGLKSFDLQRIEDHQITTLINIRSLCKEALCWVVYGVKVAPRSNILYVFDDIDDLLDRRNHHLNIKKKELENMDHYEIHNKKVEFNILNRSLA